MNDSQFTMPSLGNLDPVNSSNFLNAFYKLKPGLQAAHDAKQAQLADTRQAGLWAQDKLDEANNAPPPNQVALPGQVPTASSGGILSNFK